MNVCRPKSRALVFVNEAFVFDSENVDEGLGHLIRQPSACIPRECFSHIFRGTETNGYRPYSPCLARSSAEVSEYGKGDSWRSRTPRPGGKEGDRVGCLSRIVIVSLRQVLECGSKAAAFPLAKASYTPRTD
jgi:hypothetical protein